MGIPDSIVEEVRSRADLVEIVSEHTRLKRSGKTFRGPCPLHGGKGPNFSVDPARNLFKCFVCGEGGDVFAFPMKHLGLGFTDAVRWVAVRAGVEIPETEVLPREPEQYAELYEANAFAGEWFRARLLDPEDGREARDYLANRQITPAACERFDIGWAPEGWSGLAEAAKAHGIRSETLLALGLLKENQKSRREPYDAFRGRVIFPIQDLTGKTVGFGGRLIGPAEEHVPKYLNSPESPIYHKGELLYGLRWSRGAIRKEEVALLVEGYMDYVSLASHGFENVVAPLGTAMTPAQAELLGRYAPRVILLYDSDEAGLKATFRTADELLRSGVEVMVATLPDGEDPDSLVRTGGAPGLKRYLADAVDVLDRKIQILERRGYFSTIAKKRRALDHLLPTIRAAADDVLRGLYVARVAEKLGLPQDTIIAEVLQEQTTARKRGAKGTGSAAAEGGGTSGPTRQAAPQAMAPAPAKLGAERNVILLLVRDEQWLERAAERISPSEFLDPVYAEIFTELLHLHAEGLNRESVAWVRTLSDAAAQRVQDLLGDPEGQNLAYPERFFEENIRDLESRQQRIQLAIDDREIRRAPVDKQLGLLEAKRALRIRIEQDGGVLKNDPSRFSNGEGKAP